VVAPQRFKTAAEGLTPTYGWAFLRGDGEMMARVFASIEEWEGVSLGRLYMQDKQGLHLVEVRVGTLEFVQRELALASELLTEVTMGFSGR
jgi:hypothetical protein